MTASLKKTSGLERNELSDNHAGLNENLSLEKNVFGREI